MVEVIKKQVTRNGDLETEFHEYAGRTSGYYDGDFYNAGTGRQIIPNPDGVEIYVDYIYVDDRDGGVNRKITLYDGTTAGAVLMPLYLNKNSGFDLKPVLKPAVSTSGIYAHSNTDVAGIIVLGAHKKSRVKE